MINQIPIKFKFKMASFEELDCTPEEFNIFSNKSSFTHEDIRKMASFYGHNYTLVTCTLEEYNALTDKKSRWTSDDGDKMRAFHGMDIRSYNQTISNLRKHLIKVDDLKGCDILLQADDYYGFPDKISYLIDALQSADIITLCHILRIYIMEGCKGNDLAIGQIIQWSNGNSHSYVNEMIEELKNIILHHDRTYPYAKSDDIRREIYKNAILNLINHYETMVEIKEPGYQ
jgi:hypothetical protein